MPNHKASHSIAAQDAEVAELRASLARVTAERDAAIDNASHWCAQARQAREVAEAWEREAREARKDAERYRWLRDTQPRALMQMFHTFSTFGGDIDAAIDSARANSPPATGSAP